MSDYDETLKSASKSILSGLQRQLGDQWAGFSEKDRKIVQRVADRAAKLAAAEAAGDTEYVEKNREAVEGLIKNLEAIAAIETATFCNALLDTGLDILIKVGKKMLGVPG